MGNNYPADLRLSCTRTFQIHLLFFFFEFSIPSPQISKANSIKPAKYNKENIEEQVVFPLLPPGRASKGPFGNAQMLANTQYSNASFWILGFLVFG
jgi:hypothetical protein